MHVNSELLVPKLYLFLSREIDWLGLALYFEADKQWLSARFSGGYSHCDENNLVIDVFFDSSNCVPVWSILFTSLYDFHVRQYWVLLIFYSYRQSGQQAKLSCNYFVFSQMTVYPDKSTFFLMVWKVVRLTSRENIVFGGAQKYKPRIVGISF